MGIANILKICKNVENQCKASGACRELCILCFNWTTLEQSPLKDFDILSVVHCS